MGVKVPWLWAFKRRRRCELRGRGRVRAGRVGGGHCRSGQRRRRSRRAAGWRRCGGREGKETSWDNARIAMAVKRPPMCKNETGSLRA